MNIFKQEAKNASSKTSREIYLHNIKREKRLISTARLSIFLIFLAIWEVLAYFDIIDSFITSSPSRTLGVIYELVVSGELFYHLFVTVGEVIVGFFLGSFLGCLLAMLLWLSPFWSKVLEPYLVVINALPKIALGPLFVVWLGAGTGAIIGMTLSISIVVMTLDVLSGFLATDKELIKLTQSLGADRLTIFRKLVLPYNKKTIISALKISVGMSWVGVIVGEFLVSRAGIGYLIVYGSQVFQLDLVMAGVVVLSLMATLMYLAVLYIEKALYGGNNQ